MQDILGGVVVSIQFSSAMGARMPSHTEVFLDNAPTPATGLRCAVGSHFHHATASLFRFAATYRDEGSPSCIQDTLV